jgi:predicted PhzF superfamily epimerase YddE/YHI9
MRDYRFRQFAAFACDRYCGNAAAVVFEADFPEPFEMQPIARQVGRRRKRWRAGDSL